MKLSFLLTVGNVFFPQIYPRLLMTISKEPSDSHCRTAACPQRVVMAVETRAGHLLKISNQHFQQIVTVIVMMNSLFRYLPPSPLLSSIEFGKLLLPTLANMDVWNPTPFSQSLHCQNSRSTAPPLNATSVRPFFFRYQYDWRQSNYYRQISKYLPVLVNASWLWIISGEI